MTAMLTPPTTSSGAPAHPSSSSFFAVPHEKNVTASALDLAECPPNGNVQRCGLSCPSLEDETLKSRSTTCSVVTSVGSGPEPTSGSGSQTSPAMGQSVGGVPGTPVKLERTASSENDNAICNQHIIPLDSSCITQGTGQEGECYQTPIVTSGNVAAGKLPRTPARAPAPMDTTTCFVGHLRPDTTQEDIRELFFNHGCGEILDIRLIRERSKSAHCIFGYVDFTNTADVEKALLLEGADFKGYPLHVDRAAPLDAKTRAAVKKRIQATRQRHGRRNQRTPQWTMGGENYHQPNNRFNADVNNRFNSDVTYAYLPHANAVTKLPQVQRGLPPHQYSSNVEAENAWGDYTPMDGYYHQPILPTPVPLHQHHFIQPGAPARIPHQYSNHWDYGELVNPPNPHLQHIQPHQPSLQHMWHGQTPVNQPLHMTSQQFQYHPSSAHMELPTSGAPTNAPVGHIQYDYGLQHTSAATMGGEYISPPATAGEYSRESTLGSSKLNSGHASTTSSGNAAPTTYGFSPWVTMIAPQAMQQGQYPVPLPYYYTNQPLPQTMMAPQTQHPAVSYQTQPCHMGTLHHAPQPLPIRE